MKWDKFTESPRFGLYEVLGGGGRHSCGNGRDKCYDMPNGRLFLGIELLNGDVVNISVNFCPYCGEKSRGNS